MLTQERADILTNYLSADAAKAEKLLAMTPEEALVEINKSCDNFTVDELNEYCAAFKASVAKENGELNASDLEQVAGGVVITAGIIIGLGCCFAGGMAVGVACGAKW